MAWERFRVDTSARMTMGLYRGFVLSKLGRLPASRLEPRMCVWEPRRNQNFRKLFQVQSR